MAATSKTFSLVGDLKESTNTVKTHSILSFDPTISSEEETTVKDTVATGTTDQSISMGGIDSASMLVIMLDDALPAGFLKFKFNGSSVALTVRKFMVIMDTAITSISVTNDSGNDAAYTLKLA